MPRSKANLQGNGMTLLPSMSEVGTHSYLCGTLTHLWWKGPRAAVGWGVVQNEQGFDTKLVNLERGNMNQYKWSDVKDLMKLRIKVET